MHQARLNGKVDKMYWNKTLFARFPLVFTAVSEMIRHQGTWSVVLMLSDRKRKYGNMDGRKMSYKTNEHERNMERDTSDAHR